MTRRIVLFAGILLTALVTGVFWGTWFTLTRSLEAFSPAEFLHIGKTIIANVAVPMRLLMPSALFLLVAAVWLHPAKRSASFALLVASLGLLLATLLITLLVEVPIDNEIRRWTVATLPEDFEAKRLTWKSFHAWRTLTSVASLGALLASVLSPSGSGYASR
ncbi:MAG TPA: anthrone oxygenase family protein [Candidatus Polarisedimenticolia bacterium]|jgi:hypothetical protein|nr:anthrone oxygenase family protein [Candidatus Polarisedimenticolia bacterium]